MTSKTFKLLNYTGLNLTATVDGVASTIPCGGYRTPVDITAKTITSLKLKSATTEGYSIPEVTVTLPESVTKSTVLIGLAPGVTTASDVSPAPYVEGSYKDKSVVFLNCVGDKIITGQRAAALSVKSADSSYIALPSTITKSMISDRKAGLISQAGNITVCEIPFFKDLPGVCNEPASGSIFSKVWFWLVLIILLIIIVVVIVLGFVWYKKNKE